MSFANQSLWVCAYYGQSELHVNACMILNLRNEKSSFIYLFLILTGEQCVHLQTWRDTGEKHKATKITAANVFCINCNNVVACSSDLCNVLFQTAQCKSCDSYKKVDSRMFVQNFQTLLQKVSSKQPYISYIKLSYIFLMQKIYIKNI